MEAYIGQIMLFAGSFAPEGWAFCNGQSLPINQNAALYAVLGGVFGGDGRTTFNLPDLRGRVPVHSGASTGPGQPAYNVGQQGGSASVNLTTAQLPAHNHNLAGDASPALATSPSGGNLAQTSDGDPTSPTLSPTYTTGTPANPVNLSANAISSTGGGQAVPTMPPYTALNYIICLMGIYPTRS